MSALECFLHDLMQRQGATDTLVVSDGAAVCKTRSYQYLPISHPKPQVLSKFEDSYAVSANVAPHCPRRKGSIEDLGDRLDNETNFKTTISTSSDDFKTTISTSSDDIDDLCVLVMRKLQLVEEHLTITAKEARNEESKASATFGNDEVVREVLNSPYRKRRL